MGAMAENAFVGSSGKARLVLENYNSPVVAKVAHRSRDRMTVKQALPFLKLDTGVRDEQGRRAVIRSVGVSVEGGTPNLVLDLEYDATIGPSDPRIGLDDTIPVPIKITSARPRRGDPTIPFGFPRRNGRREHVEAARRQRKAFVPDEAQGCYLLTRRKREPKVVIASEKEAQIHREKTLIMNPGELRERRVPPIASGHLAEAPLVPPMASGHFAETSIAPPELPRNKPSFSSRAKALAAAFWGYWGDSRERDGRAR